MTEVHQRFRDWVESDPRSQADLARALQCDASQITNLIKGRRWPGRRLANAIERETNRLIRSTDWDEAEDATREPATT